MAADLDRGTVLAYRAWTQGLHADRPVTSLDALTIGFQDTPAGSAGLALRHRTPDPPPLDDPDLVLALTVRGSPHLHRRADLPFIRAALRPHDNESLRPYLGGFGDTLASSGADGPALVAEVAAELRRTFPGEVATKGELSGAVSPGLPASVRPWCAGCGTDHVADGMFRIATLYAGIELVPGDRRLRFRLGPRPKEAADDHAATELLHRMVRQAGPLRLGDVVMWLDTRSVTAPPDWLRPVWTDLADRLVEVTVADATLTADREMLAVLGDAPAPPSALLLPPRDPYLLGHRPFLAPDRTLAKEIWRPVGSPGALVVDGDVAGGWRARKSGRTLRLTVTSHRELTATQRKALDGQVDVVAAARANEGTVTLEIQ